MQRLSLEPLLALVIFGISAVSACAAEDSGTPITSAPTPKPAAESVLHEYFDIAHGSPAGAAVIGRLNLARNRNVESAPIPESYEFVLVGGAGANGFTLHNIRNADGQLFGEFRIAEGESVTKGAHDVLVELRNEGRVLSKLSATIHVVSRTQWDRYHDRVVRLVDGTGRLTGRRNLTDDEIASYIRELEHNGGAFNDLTFYGASTLEEQIAIGAKQLGKDLQEAANRIGGLGKAYHEGVTGKRSSSQWQPTDLRRVLYLALIAYVDHFPLEDFGDTAALSHSDRSHQWRFLDPISGAATLIFEDMLNDIIAGVESAHVARERVERLQRIVNFDLPMEWRHPDHLRYFLKSDLGQSGGAWSDANRHHRMRSWATMPVIIRDYNRPLTDLPYWYADYEPFASAGTSLLPGWEPRGSFGDLRIWLETNARYPYTYGQSGLVPDGTISHHIGSRQDIAFWAYGFEWMLEVPGAAFRLLKDTPWRISNRPYDQSAEFLLFAYPKLIYRSGMDYQVVGRSFESDVGDFGRTELVHAIDNLFAAGSEDTVISKASELMDFRESLASERHENSGNTAFWTNDFMIHRRGGEAGETPYYMSVKMQSARTRGAESFSPVGIGFHNGSGTLQVKVDGVEYDAARSRWDWHALSGVTEELRTDRSPRQSDHKLFNPNHFAGMASNGRYGFAAFDYFSDNPYTSAAARKAYFFAGDQVLSMGQCVARTRNTDNSDVEPIITTIEQASWDSDLTYSIDPSGPTATVPAGTDIDTILKAGETSWFHQDRIGYVVLSDDAVDLMVRGGASVIDSDPSDASSGDVFHIAISHGTRPGSGCDGDEYAYVIIPNVSAEDMPAIAKSVIQDFDKINLPNVQGHRYVTDALEIVQVAFYEAGSAQFDNGLVISVDNPALVQLQRVDDKWDVVVQNPTHHADEAAVAALPRFGQVLLPYANEIRVNLSLALSPGRYPYATQGPVERRIEGQFVEIQADGRGSVLIAHLPDGLDAEHYRYREAFYAGMPARITVEER